MSYDPIKMPKDMDTNVDDVEPNSGESGVYKVNVSIKKSKKELFKTYLNNIKNMDRHTINVWFYGMWLNMAYILVGLVGIFTLTWYVPFSWTSTPSLKQARELAIAKQQRRLRKEYEESLRKKELDENHVVEELPTYRNAEEEMDSWLRKMRGDGC